MQRTTKGILALLLICILLCAGIPYLPELGFLLLPAQVQEMFRIPTWGCGDSRCAVVFPRAYPMTVTLEDQRQGITERWCVTYTIVRPHTGLTGVYWRWAYQNGRVVERVVERKNGSYGGFLRSVSKDFVDPRFASYCGASR